MLLNPLSCFTFIGGWGVNFHDFPSYIGLGPRPTIGPPPPPPPPPRSVLAGHGPHLGVFTARRLDVITLLYGGFPVAITRLLQVITL